MIGRENSSHISPAALGRAVQEVEPAALFVEPRILRRVIKQDRRIAGIGLHVPHARAYTIGRERLLVIADRSELNLSPAAELPQQVILLARPHDEEALELMSPETALYTYWRLLFHACVHLQLDARLAGRELNDDVAFERLQQLGAAEFAEIRSVLSKDELLLPPQTDLEVYVEFVAVYLELRHFAPGDLPLYFPAIHDWARVDAIVTSDVDGAALYEQTRLRGAPERVESPVAYADDVFDRAPAEPEPRDPLEPSPPRFWRLLARAERAGRVGNRVQAAVRRMQASRLALPDRISETRLTAQAELRRLARRLQLVWHLTDDETEEWADALVPLLGPASRGYWNTEARLLYDLQNVCVEHERGVFRFDFPAWVRSRGRRPIKRSLPLLRDVLIGKHLRSAARRLPTVHLASEDRRRLSNLLAQAADRVEHHLRERIRPRIVTVLDEVGLVPGNVPEEVSRHKLVEELLDRIVDRGFINMGDLRDALSQNQVKLSDVSGVLELLKGDKLLRADRRLATVLDGVYRPGAIYLRWPQRLSSLAFGTRFGRFMTQYVVLPFGGSFLALEGLRHVAGWFTRHRPEAAVEALAGAAADAERISEPVASLLNPTAAAIAASPFANWPFYAAVLLLGVVLLLIMHWPHFRRWLVRMAADLWRLGRKIVIDLPTGLIHAPVVQKILQSQVYSVLRHYAFRPALFTLLFWLPAWLADRPWSRAFTTEFFLAANLFLNSPVGRYAEEWLTDVLVRSWHELRIRVFAAAFQWVMDLFHQLLQGLERIIYVVDEWLRFRAGDARPFVVVKIVLSLGWFLVSYVIRFYVTLLIEPQVNPIKHFPVVTVSHKIMLPYSIVLTQLLATPLEPFMGSLFAKTFAAANVLLFPGVFGFLVWELKENWRLYEANRSPNLVPIPVGHHGETIVRFLRPGLHSGTLSKLFARLRRALRDGHRTGHWHRANQYLATLHGAEISVRRFVDRELGGLLQSDQAYAGNGVPVVGEIRLATDRIDVELCLGRTAEDSLWLRFEELAGWLSASIPQTGWLSSLDLHQRNRFNVALAGLYKLAGVDLVQERLAMQFPRQLAWQTVVNRGVVVCSGPARESCVLYPVRYGFGLLTPQQLDGQPAAHWPTLERWSLLFRASPIRWDHWVQIWTSQAADDASSAPEGIPEVLPPRPEPDAAGVTAEAT